MSGISIPGFDLIKEIGSGAGGRVWLGRDRNLDQYRAIKFVRRREPESVRAFQREFEGIRSFEPLSRKHPALIDILQLGPAEIDDFFYYVMEPADDWFTRRPLSHSTDLDAYQPRTLTSDLQPGQPHADAVEITLTIARGLKAIHDQGLVHRDIKPANIVYVDNEPKLADPGLITQAGAKTAVGTFGYVAPEITFGQAASRQSDIFSLGKLFYQLFTGQPPEEFPSLSNQVDESQIRQANPIWNQACDPEPEARFPAVESFINRLNQLDDEETSAETSPPPHDKKTTVKLFVRDAEGIIIFDQVLIEGEYSIGRSDSNDLVIPDSFISRNHAAIHIGTQGVEIEDKKSTGGTFIGGRKVAGRVAVGEQDIISIGDHYISIAQVGLQPGSTLGAERYQLQQRLGQGRAGEVWRAFDVHLQEEIALKVFSVDWLEQDEFLDELRREVKRARKLTHENILKVFDIHVTGEGPPFLTMEYIQGVSLEEHRLNCGVMTWPELLPLIDQLCAAVDYAHSKKTVHRDVKPSNILIGSGGLLKLADFGVARTLVTSTFTRGMTEDTFAGEIAGTIAFMSPQVINGENPAPDDDIYAIGVTLYELLTGCLPFYDDDQQEMINKIMSPDVPAYPIDRLMAEHGISNTVPEHICAAIMACLSKNQDHRPQKAQMITANYS